MSEHQLPAGFNDFINTALKDWNYPGCAVAVVKDGEVIHAFGYGLRDVEHNLPVTENTLFAIGSCTKAFTALCLGMLVDEGKLDWDKPVRDYIPDFRLFDSFATERMTARDLLCHRSGLPRHDSIWYATTSSREDLFKRLRHLEPNKDFRAVWQYQNLMYMTAGVLVERVANCTWEDFVRQRIFAPLGMTTSNLSVTDSQRAVNFAHPYHEKEDRIKEIPFHNLDAIGPAGSINSSVSEIAHWLLLQLNKGKYGDKQLISEATLREMHTPQMVMAPGNPEDKEFGYPSYGLGWLINTYRGHLFVQHGGGIDGFVSMTTLLPEQNAGIVVLTNRDSGELAGLVTFHLQDRLLDLEPVDWNKRMKERRDKAKQAEQEAKEKKAEQEQGTPAAGATATHPIADYAGTYEHPGYGPLTVKLDGEQLSASYGTYQLGMRHLRYDTFEASLEDLEIKQSMQFHMDVEGHVSALSIALEVAAKPIEFKRLADAGLRERGTLEKFTGQYELMGMTATVALRGEDVLIITVPGQPTFELLPVDPTRFRLKGLEGFSVEFIVGEDGRVSEAIFHQPNGDFTAKRK